MLCVKTRRSLSTSLVALALLALPGDAIAAPFDAAMTRAIVLHDEAKDVAGEIAALEEFREVAKAHPDRWLGHYWAAYLCTQVARLSGRAPDFPHDLDPKDLIREARSRYQKAADLAPPTTPEVSSDLLALRGLIDDFHARIVAENGAEKGRYFKRQKEAHREAVRPNPESPVMMVMVGSSLVRETDSYEAALAALALFDQADAVFARAGRRSVTAHFSRDFVPFWRQRAEQRLRELVAKAGQGVAQTRPVR